MEFKLFYKKNAIAPYSPNSMFYNHPPLCLAKNDFLKIIL